MVLRFITAQSAPLLGDWIGEKQLVNLNWSGCDGSIDSDDRECKFPVFLMGQPARVCMSWMFIRVLLLCSCRRAETRLFKLQDKPLATRSCMPPYLWRSFCSFAGSIRPAFPQCFLACTDQYFTYLFWSFALSNHTLMHCSLKKGLPGLASSERGRCYGEQRQITLFFTLPISSVSCLSFAEWDGEPSEDNHCVFGNGWACPGGSGIHHSSDTVSEI